MPNQQKIHLMTRLAILEKENGKELKRMEESFRSDYIGIPMLKNGLRITAVFLVLLCIWAVGNIDFILSAMADLKLKSLGIGILTAYIVVLLVTLIITFLCASAAYYRNLPIEEEYRWLLKQLAEEEDPAVSGPQRRPLK